MMDRLVRGEVIQYHLLGKSETSGLCFQGWNSDGVPDLR